MTITITDIAALGVLITAIAQYFTLKSQVQILADKVSALLEALRRAESKNAEHERAVIQHDARLRALENRDKLWTENAHFNP